MMCEKKHEVKKGLNQMPEDVAPGGSSNGPRSSIRLDFKTIGVAFRKRLKWKTWLLLVARELNAAAGLHGFSQPPTDKPEGGCRGIALWLKRKDRGLSGKFIAAIKLQAGVFQEFSRKTHVFGAVHTPEPQLFLVALQEMQRLPEFLHCPVKRGGQKIYAQGPAVARVLHSHPNAILAVLVFFNAAAPIALPIKLMVVCRVNCTVRTSLFGQE